MKTSGTPRSSLTNKSTSSFCLFSLAFSSFRWATSSSSWMVYACTGLIMKECKWRLKPSHINRRRERWICLFPCAWSGGRFPVLDQSLMLAINADGEAFPRHLSVGAAREEPSGRECGWVPAIGFASIGAGVGINYKVLELQTRVQIDDCLRVGRRGWRRWHR